MTQRAWASRTRRCNEASAGSTLNRYVIFSSSFSCSLTGVGCVSSATASDTGRSASSQPSGPVWTREWLVPCKKEPDPHRTRKAAAGARTVPFGHSPPAVDFTADSGKEPLTHLPCFHRDTTDLPAHHH